MVTILVMVGLVNIYSYLNYSNYIVMVGYMGDMWTIFSNIIS
jgi:hypothetical protein